MLYFSIHRYEHGRFWPNLRESDFDRVGDGRGVGFNVNVPLNNIAMENKDYMAIIHYLLTPLAIEVLNNNVPRVIGGTTAWSRIGVHIFQKRVVANIIQLN